MRRKTDNPMAWAFLVVLLLTLALLLAVMIGAESDLKGALGGWQK